MAEWGRFRFDRNRAVETTFSFRFCPLPCHLLKAALEKPGSRGAKRSGGKEAGPAGARRDAPARRTLSFSGLVLYARFSVRLPPQKRCPLGESYPTPECCPWRQVYKGFPGRSVLKNNEETRVRSLGWEDPLEEEMATHSSVLARKIPWTEEPGGLQSMGSHRLGHN